jgi:MoaA/NifB/PqqE/SkfB family radical SAM enzyme/protein-L-isoaspartate O-methyltransferase
MQGHEFFKQIAGRPPFTRLDPRMAAFFRSYLENEKAVRFGDQWVVNTHFPPYPGRAFDRLAEQFGLLGDADRRRLFSVTLAVTNRCPFNCWHCYNAGRSQTDVPLPTLRQVAHELLDLGAVVVTLTGGEPLLRRDLEELVAGFDARCSLILGTTGAGLTRERAAALKAAGLFGVGISLDSDQPEEHDRLRGRAGAYQMAVAAVGVAREAGLYPYVVTVATHELLPRERFIPFLWHARDIGALEVHLMEPSATGNLAGNTGALLSAAERQQLIEYQREAARDESLPIVSSLAYLESASAFGCGAGLTHLYIDGSGEVCPCNLVPLSFGNVTREPLAAILARMGQHFVRPRTGCVGRTLARHTRGGPHPLPPEQSCGICGAHLPAEHPLPVFFELQSHPSARVGRAELEQAYNQVGEVYDNFWLSEAAGPIEALAGLVDWRGVDRVFEAGCGTGYGTALLTSRAGHVLAVDLSAGMQQQAQARLSALGCANVEFRLGDALAALRETGGWDVVFSSWVLGYIPLQPFLEAAARALRPGGQLAFVVHRDGSPREATGLFAELVAEQPDALEKQVAFDFPADAARVRALLAQAGLDVVHLAEGEIVFRCADAPAVLEHLLKSGAGTAFHEALAPAWRAALTERFLSRLAARHAGETEIPVPHEYVICVARKPGPDEIRTASALAMPSSLA